MARNEKADSRNGTPARVGVRLPDASEEDTAVQCFRFAMGLAHQVLDGKITPKVCVAAAAAMCAGLRAMELQYKYGNKPLPALRQEE